MSFRPRPPLLSWKLSIIHLTEYSESGAGDSAAAFGFIVDDFVYPQCAEARFVGGKFAASDDAYFGLQCVNGGQCLGHGVGIWKGEDHEPGPRNSGQQPRFLVLGICKKHWLSGC